MTVRILLRGGTAAEWTSANPTLAAREVGVETDTHKAKIGDGTTAWTSLAYLVAAAGALDGALDDLTDVTITAAASGDILRYNGSAWVDVDGTTIFQPLDSDLTAIAALTTTTTGRSLLAAADAAAIRTIAGVGTIGTQASSSVSITGGSITGITDLAVADGGTGGSDAATARTNLGLVIGTNVQAYDGELAAIAGLTSAADRLPYFTGSGTASLATFTAAGRALLDDADAAAQRATLQIPEVIIVAVGDETTAITTGTAKVTFRMPFAMTLTAVRASLTTASSSGIPTVDINEGAGAGTSILSTKLTIDQSELTSTTAATAAVISDTALADDAQITIDIDVAGTGAAGLKVALIGTRA